MIGFFLLLLSCGPAVLLVAAGNDSTKAMFCVLQRRPRSAFCGGLPALLEGSAQHARFLADPALVPRAVAKVTRDPGHQALGAGDRHFGLGAALARLELRIMLEETLARFPRTALDGEPVPARSPFINQLKSLPVRLG